MPVESEPDSPGEADGDASVDPRTCESAGVSCGVIDDGTGRFLACGECEAPASCGGGGVDGQCGCTPRTCQVLGAHCGAVDDGCGGTLDCGGCADGESCGGTGVANECGAPLCDGSVCFVAPYPQPDDLSAVHVDPQGTLWAGGAMGRAMRRTATGGWQHVTTLTRSPANLEAFWLSGQGDGWAVGSGGRGALLRFDGELFNCARPDGTFWAELGADVDVTWSLYALWGRSASELWAAGEQGVLRFDGERWSVEHRTSSTAQLFAMDGTSDGSLWAVGRTAAGGRPVVLRRTEAGWSAERLEDSGLNGELRTVSVDAGGSVWAAGATYGADGRIDRALVLKRAADGTWNRIPTDAPSALYTSAADQEGGVWFAGAGGVTLHARDRTTQSFPPLLGSGDIRGLVRADGALHAVGAGGMVAQLRRGVWWPNRTRSLLSPDSPAAVLWEQDAGWVWAAGDDWVMHYDGRRWGTAGISGRAVGVFGVAPHALWIAANDEDGGVVYFHDGQSIAEVARTEHTLESLSGTSSTDVRAVAGDQVLHYDGVAWDLHPTDAFEDTPALPDRTVSWELEPGSGFKRRGAARGAQALWPYQGLERGASAAVGGNDGALWAAGPDGLLQLGEPSELTTLCGQPRALAASGATLWLAGEGDAQCGPLWRMDGGELDTVAAPVGETSLRGVAVGAEGDLWVAGSGLHHSQWPDPGWHQQELEAEEPFTFVHVTATGDVWAASGPLLFHRQGQQWQTTVAWDLMDFPPFGVATEELWLHDAHSLPSGEVFFIGTTPEREAAVLLLRTGEDWSSALLLQSLDGESVFTDVWAASPEEVYVSKGELGYVYRFDATNGSPSFDDVMAVTDRPLDAIWGDADGTLWMFGPFGVIARTMQ